MNRIAKTQLVLLTALIVFGLMLAQVGSIQAQAIAVQAQPATPIPSAAVPAPPPNQPELGLIYNGLVPASNGACRAGYQAKRTALCTHGPDPAPRGVDIAKRIPARERLAETAAQTALCDGDGTSGKRVQLLYAHAAD